MSCNNSYDLNSVQRKPLKLKGDSGKVHKKKKKKHKKEKKKLEQVRLDPVDDQPVPSGPKYDTLTPAERRFKETQEKRQLDRIIKKATMTHRDRVEEFNRNLENLSEHYDIPKVSWTK
uniref:Protein FAM32A-like n=1 Tax=Phallusia mammillata TaxID=59560 RepID=A0A6F9DBS4_9ASCI|nr:protein FAM32A-like [Phallusia mammillata]